MPDIALTDAIGFISQSFEHSLCYRANIIRFPLIDNGQFFRVTGKIWSEI